MGYDGVSSYFIPRDAWFRFIVTLKGLGFRDLGI